jgi:hypothetical protein
MYICEKHTARELYKKKKQINIHAGYLEEKKESGKFF